MNTKPRVVAIVSDIHAGSTVALMPPTFTRKTDGITVEANAIQAFYWEAWKRANAWLAELVGDDPFLLVLNGDLIEGVHHRSTEIISANSSDHVDLAAEILLPLAKRAAKTFLTRGTECHTGDSERALGEILGGQLNEDTGSRVFDRLELRVCGCNFVARHHVSTTSRPWLESNGLGLELASEQLNAARSGDQVPNVLAVAHRHVGGHVVTTGGVCLCTPAWQGLTRHGNKVVPASRCKPGLYVLDWRGVGDGELPAVRAKIYEARHQNYIEA